MRAKFNPRLSVSWPILFVAALLAGCGGLRVKMLPEWNQWLAADAPRTTVQSDELVLEVGGIV